MKKASKKILAVLLAAILAAASMPFVAFADSAASNLESAIAEYEQKMDGTIWLNMTDAYDAYVEANKALDAYKFGGININVDSYASNLRNKTNAMTRWEQQYAKRFIDIISTGNQAFPDDSTGDADLARYEQYGVQNVLAWKKAEESLGSKISDGQIGNTEIELWCYPNVVLLVDDSGNAPQFPVMAMAVKRTNGNTRWVWQLYPSKSLEDNSNSNDFRMTDNWHASTTPSSSNRNKNWTWTMGLSMGDAVQGNNNGDGNMGFAMGWAGAVSQTYRTRLMSNRRWLSMANVVRYTGSFDGYYKTYDSIPFYRVTGDGPDELGYINATYPIHIIKYEPLLKTMKQTKKGLLQVAEDTYTQGGLRDVLAAYDKATKIDPVNVNYAADLGYVQSIGRAIGEADEALKNATAITDTTGYSSLRKAISLKKGIYEAGSEGYKPVSWSDFVAVYDEAVEIFADIQMTGYNSTTNEHATSEYAQEMADRLNALDIVPLYDKVDTNNLEMIIDEADDAIGNKSMFTSDSYAASNIENVVALAKAAIWGAVENYPNAKFKLNLDDANTAIVEAQTDLVKAAIYALRVDKTTAVSSAGDHSMVSAVAKAAEYSSDDYGNYADLASAVAAANSFVVTVNNITKDCIGNKLSEYKEKVRAIIYSINTLRPAFDKITNGTFGSMTKHASTLVRSTGDASGGPRWTLDFVRDNDIVVFRTEYAPMKIDLGGATLEWYSKDNDYDAHLDTINVYDVSEENKIGELVTSWATAGLNPGAVSIEDVADQYPGMLSASTEENSTYVLKNLTVSQSAASKLGCDFDGKPITDTSFIFDEILSATQGSSSSNITGTVTTNRGSAWINAEYTLSVPRESKKTLSAKTLPKITKHELASNFGMVYFWKYIKNTIRWQGYSHDRVPYNQTTYVMNIAPLIELIQKSREYEDKEQLYQITPWNNFTTALSAARADMDYGNMSAEDIETACQTRYTNLWNAYIELIASPAANNKSIHDAVEADENVGNVFKADNKDGRWSPSRWATFKAAYETAAAAIETGGIYSDYNVRNFNEDEQDAIDEIAEDLTYAYNELIKYGARADFTPIYEAAQDIVVDAQTGLETHTLENNKYTVQSLEALKNALSDTSRFPYLNMSEEQKSVTYSESNIVSAIAKEARAIKSAYSVIPVEKDADADDSALEAAKTYAKSLIKDPDAYSNIAEIKALIDNADNSQEVNIYGNYSVCGVKYSSKDEINAAVTALLSGLSVKKYAVKVVDEQGKAVNVKFEDMNGNEIASENGEISIDYGTRIRIIAPNNEEADWFYQYSSKTVELTSSKYYTTDKRMSFVVKGDTTLTIKSAQAETETVKITYVNALTGKTFGVDYTEKNQEYSLMPAPALAYYNFIGYSVDEESESYVTSITPLEDMVIVANYEPSETAEYYTVTIGNLSASVTTTQAISNLDYNDLVEFTLGDGTADAETGGLYRSTNTNGQYKVNGEVKALTGRGVRYRGSEIYAWVIVKEDDAFLWSTYRKNPGLHAGDLADIEKVVMYGDTYNFRVHESVYVIPYTQDEFEAAVENGYVETGDENKAASFVKENILNETDGDRISMIGSFTLPAGEQYSLVEAGILFKATTNGTIPAGDLTLGNVGTNGISRMKSSQHTVGNQYVISVNTAKLHNVTINAIYRAYMIYTDGTNQYIVYSNAVTDSADIA